jgi:prepilin-type processing-associated H-X9-DG protein
MNSHIRRRNPAQQAKVTDVKQATDYVYLGDAVSMDYHPPLNPDGTAVFENGQFSFEVNDITEANPAMRHLKGCNILFMDFHAANIRLVTRRKPLRAPLNGIVVDTWESEFCNASGVPVDLGPSYDRTAESQGLHRNPDMPLRWSTPGKLYRAGQP